MGEYVEDWRAFRNEQYVLIEGSGLSGGDMLVETRELIRAVRQALPEYRRVQESLRYQMTVEDLEDVELMFSQHANDVAGVFDPEDLVDNLVQARCVHRIVTDILGKAAEGIWPKFR